MVVIKRFGKNNSLMKKKSLCALIQTLLLPSLLLFLTIEPITKVENPLSSSSSSFKEFT